MTDTTLNCRPHVNGNSPEEFLSAAQDILNRVRQLELAMSNALAGPLHGRNYQHVEGDWYAPADARRADFERWRKLAASLADISEFAIELGNRRETA